MKIYELLGWHLFKVRHEANGKTKAILVEGVKDEKPRVRVKCPECEKVFFPMVEPDGAIPTQGRVDFRTACNWPETGNIILALNCPHCNWVGEGWFTLVEVRG